MLTDEQVDAYLERIAYEGDGEVCLATLDELIFQHQCTIPFETLTLRRRAGAPSLHTRDIYEQVVRKHRGGYCFELNKLFYELLVTLGFDARPSLSRSEIEPGVLAPINHRATLVALSGQLYLAEVGFGGPVPARALPLLDGEAQSIEGAVFRTQRIDECWWNIDRLKVAGSEDPQHEQRRWNTELSLCTARVEDVDFEAMNVACSAPGSLFRDHTIVNLRTPGGYLGLMDDAFTRREGDQKVVRIIEDPEVLESILTEAFGMGCLDDLCETMGGDGE